MRVVPRVVAERALDADVVTRDRPLEHDLRVRRHFEVDRLAPHELDRLPAQEAGEHELVEMMRKRSRGSVGRHGVESDRHRDRDLAVVRREQVRPSVLVHLPVHEGRAAVDYLHPIHADVADTGRRILRDDRRQRDERRRVARPAALDRKRGEVDPVALEDHLLADALRDRLRERVRDRLQLQEALHLLDDPLRRLHVEHVAELRRRVVQLVDAECHAHAALGAELVDEERVLRALRLFEQERRPAGLHDAIRDLRDLEVGIDLRCDPAELARALEERDPVAEISRCRHGWSVYGDRLSRLAEEAASAERDCAGVRATS